MRPWTIHHGDVRAVARTLEAKSFDAICCDPPYGLRFMGRRWDYSVPSVNVWSALLRLLRPGAHAVIFGGSRTFHRLAVNVEDGGFEIRDVLMWLYGTGMPKGLDVSQAIDRQLGAKRTKVIGHKQGVRAEGGSGHGAAVPNQKKVSVSLPITAPATELATDWDGYNTVLKPAYEPALLARRMSDANIAECAIRYGVGGIDVASTAVKVPGEKDRYPSNVVVDDEVAAMMGGAARYFYSTKASRSEREAGLQESGMEEVVIKRLNGSFADGNFETTGRNTHPTVKPQDLVRYFARMVLPPKRRDGRPRRILVPFSGSGSEVIACLQAGWDEVVGIEREQEYCEIAEARIRRGKIFDGKKGK